jgi:poly(3-hydroxybutyrate) depolymerase
MRIAILIGTSFVVSSCLFGCGGDDATPHDAAVDAITFADVSIAPVDAANEAAVDAAVEAGVDAGVDARVAPVGSAGCGRAAPAIGELTLTVGSDTLQYIVSIPANYDPSHPYPLGFGLHGANRTHTNCHDGDCAGFQSVMQDEAILVYTRSVSAGWQDDDNVRDRNLALFTAVLDKMLAEACVEVGRVFVAGTSSGATFTNILGCAHGDRIRAVIPVAGGLPSRAACVGTPAALVIHGVDDPHVLFSYGEAARDAYRMTNGCTSETDPVIADLHARVVATRESHECADYRGCAPGLPVRWCEHSEGGYDGSTHGWPLFGGAAIWEFVSALP